MKKYCENCGKELKGEFKVCPYCTNNKTKKKIPDYVKVGLIMFGIMCGIVLLAIIFGEPIEEDANQDNTNTPTTSTKTTEPTTTKSVDQLRQEESDFKKSCKSYTYKDLYRNIEKYTKEKIKVKGKVIQVMEGSYSYELRLDMTKNEYGWYEDTIYILLHKDNVEQRILEDDIITIYGTITGLKTYESVLGANITLPEIAGKYVEFN